MVLLSFIQRIPHQVPPTASDDSHPLDNGSTQTVRSCYLHLLGWPNSMRIACQRFLCCCMLLAWLIFSVLDVSPCLLAIDPWRPLFNDNTSLQLSIWGTLSGAISNANVLIWISNVPCISRRSSMVLRSSIHHHHYHDHRRIPHQLPPANSEQVVVTRAPRLGKTGVAYRYFDGLFN